VDTVKAATALKHLVAETPYRGWGLRQWELKLELFAANRDIGGAGDIAFSVRSR